jgi:cobalt-zinc-cadmium efflux system protein
MAADAGVSLSVVVAGLTIAATGWLWLDPAVSLVIAAVITVSTWGLLRESVDLALDAVPAGIDPGEVRAFLAAQPGVASVHDLHIWAMSTTETALTAHVVRPGAGSSDGFLHDAAHALQERFGIDHATIQVERGATECHLEPETVV